MKLKVQTICIAGMWLFCMMIVPAFGQMTISTALYFDVVSDDSSPKTSGYEITTPLRIAYDQDFVAYSLETAYSCIYVDSDGESELCSVTDMLYSASRTYTFSRWPVGIMLGMDLNIPSGKERLSDEETALELGENSDLFKIDNFGEGQNISLSLGLISQIQSAALAFQGAYIFNDEFDPTSETEDDNIDPGDQFLLVGFFEWQASSVFTLGTFVSYSHFTADRTEGEEYFRQADQVSLGTNLQINQGTMEGVIHLNGTFSGKNESLEDDTMETESENSNGTDFSGTVAVTYNVSEKFNVWINGDILYYGESELEDDQSGLPYSGKRIRYAGGSGLNYRLNSRLSWNAAFEVFTMKQDLDMFIEEDVTYQGVNLGVGMTYTL